MMAPNIGRTRTALLSNTSRLPADRSRGRTKLTGKESWSDFALLQRCAQRDSAAMQVIVQRYQQQLYRFLNQMIGSAEDTEEAVLDVFVRVWQQAERFEGRAGFSTWLYRIAANVAYDHLRQRKGQPRTEVLFDWSAVDTVNAETVVLDNLEQAERSRQLQKALQMLRVDDRLLLILYYAEEMGYEEIREITRYSYPVLKMRLMRARKRLRVIMDTLASEVSE